MPQGTFNTKSYQTIYDIALAVYGSMEGVVDLLVDNQLSFDSALPASLVHQEQDNYVVRYLKGTDITTASALIPTTASEQVYVNTGNGDKEEVRQTPTVRKTFLVTPEQNIFDAVVQITGSMEDVVDYLFQNNLTFESHLGGVRLPYSSDLFMDTAVETGGNPVQPPVITFGAFDDGFSEGFE